MGVVWRCTFFFVALPCCVCREGVLMDVGGGLGIMLRLGSMGEGG